MAITNPAVPLDQPATSPSLWSRIWQNDAPGYLFLLPWLIGFFGLTIGPMVTSLYLSFTDFDLLTSPEFIGVENYQRLLNDPLFWNALGTTSWYVLINIGLQTVLALGIAVLMQRLTQSMVVRGVIMFPYLIANVIAALVWFYMFDFQFGIINEIIDGIGLDRIAFFGESEWAIPTVAFINVWRHMGYTALLISYRNDGEAPPSADGRRRPAASSAVSPGRRRRDGAGG